MNILHSTQEKRTVKVKDFLEDFRSGITDSALMAKYHLTPTGLDRFYALLIDREILHPSDFEHRVQSNVADEPPPIAQVEAKPRFYCPSCLASQETIFDLCPECGFDLRDSGRRRSAQPQHEGLCAANPQRANAGAELGNAGRKPVEVKDAASEVPMGKGRKPDHIPIEIPLKESQQDDFFHESDWDYDKEVFGGGSSEFNKNYSAFDDTGDHVMSGMPLDYADPTAEGEEGSDFRCLHCGGNLDTGVRKIYDQQASRRAFGSAAVFMVLGLLGALGLMACESSFLRLAVVYFAGTSMLLGSCLMALAVFMSFLAQEQVYLCIHCGRTYPRV